MFMYPEVLEQRMLESRSTPVPPSYPGYPGSEWPSKGNANGCMGEKVREVEDGNRGLRLYKSSRDPQSRTGRNEILRPELI